MKSNSRYKGLSSVGTKLFCSLCIVIVITILFIITINNVVLENFYIYHKRDDIRQLCRTINSKYQENESEEKIKLYIRQEALRKNLDIFIRDEKMDSIISSSIDQEDSEKSIQYILDISKMNANKSSLMLYKSNNTIIKKIADSNKSNSFIVAVSRLDNGNDIYIKTSIGQIKDTLNVSNNILICVGAISVVISAIIASVVAKKFTKPILELNDIAKKMSNLDFSQRYIPRETENEIDELGESINSLSKKLEETINELKKDNDDLERDIKKKSKIDEMRAQFISDVSHELKTPIALIQGYAEGLAENVNEDEEAKNYYASVIIDEANKMDKLVKQLLELMKLEYKDRKFNDAKFDIVSLITDNLKKYEVMIEEQNIEAIIKNKEPIYVFADSFYIEQVITNYLTNAIKYSKEINGKKKVIIEVTDELNGNVRISVYNTGDNFSDEEQKKIWGRFYKIDSSRNRSKGGTGIGLSIVKAIMDNYDQKYGVQNRVDGIEFYIELKKAES